MNSFQYTTIFLSFILISFLTTSCSSVKNLNTSPIGLINNVSFKKSEFDNDNASNGFLVKYNKKNYVITAKHILNIAKTDKMQFIDFEGELKQWKLHPKGNPLSYILTDQLLNTNQKDSLTWGYMGNNWETYDDFLIFSVKENKSKHKPLKFRKEPLVKGDKLFAIGWTYADTLNMQPVYEYAYQETTGNYHVLTEIKGPKKMGGLSGSPIVDSKGDVVGLVSSGWEDEEKKVVYLEATSTENMLKFLEKSTK